MVDIDGRKKEPRDDCIDGARFFSDEFSRDIDRAREIFAREEPQREAHRHRIALEIP